MSGGYDPRDDDSRGRGDGIRDREEDWLQLGRGPGSTAVRGADDGEDVRHRDEDRREERDREPGERDGERGGIDPRDVFMRDLDLPRGVGRELVHDRDRDYALRGSETRTLSTVGAFRVVAERDLRDPRDAAFEVRESDLRHLKDEGLIQRVSLDGRDRAVALTDRGRSLLEHHRRDHDPEHRQVFYSGADKARERTHDTHFYSAYLRAAERLQEREARILRVELDRELKREYQRFLQEGNRGDSHSDGRPDRTPEEIEQWAHEHALPYFDEHVHFPDVRIEYEDVNGDVRNQDIEVTTEHYRGGHASATARSGFAIYSGGGGGSGGGAFDPRVAEDFLR
jgi:hypothetical protein